MKIQNFVLILVIAFAVVQHCSAKVHPKNGKALKHKRLPHRGKHILRRLPRGMSSPEEEKIKSICEEICENTQDLECKGALTLKTVDYAQGTCTCSDQTGTLIIRRLTKPQTSSSPKSIKRLVGSTAGIPCNESDYKSCQRICKQQFPSSDTSKCSENKMECLCYSSFKKGAPDTTLSRTKRQLIIEEIMDTGEEIIGMDLNPPVPTILRSPKFFGGPGGGGGGGGRRPPHPYSSSSHHSYDEDHHHMSRCTPYTCIDQCPPGCDSLCRPSQECYCSCPHDLTYDYYDNDDYSFTSLFG